MRVGWREELLEVGEVVELEMVGEESGLDAHAFAELQECWLAREAGRGGFCIQLFDRWRRCPEYRFEQRSQHACGVSQPRRDSGD